MRLHEEIPFEQRFAGVEDEHEDSNRLYPRTINMHSHDEQSRRLSSDPVLLGAVRQLLADEPRLYQTMCYFKPPAGRGQALHQDMAIINLDPLLGVWMPLETASAAVGPMVVVDKSHTDGFAQKKDVEDMSSSFTSGEAIPRAGRELHELEMDAGDVLFFVSLCPRVRGVGAAPFVPPKAAPARPVDGCVADLRPSAWHTRSGREDHTWLGQEPDAQ